MLFVQLTKWPHKPHAVRCQFCQLRKWPPARMPERVYRPVRPLVLIHNSMVYSYDSSSQCAYLYLVHLHVGYLISVLGMWVVQGDHSVVHRFVPHGSVLCPPTPSGCNQAHPLFELRTNQNQREKFVGQVRFYFGNFHIAKVQLLHVMIRVQFYGYA